MLWGEDNLLWAATKGRGATRVLKLTRKEGKTHVEEVWKNRKIKIDHWEATRIGDHVYTSSGDGRKSLSVVDVKTGEILETVGGFGAMNGIHRDGRLILLDDKGRLALAAVSPGKIEVLASTRILKTVTWTVPLLAGNRLFIRNRKDIMAYELDWSGDG